MLKKKKYAKNQLDDQGPDWGDLKPVENEPVPVLKKTEKVIQQDLSSFKLNILTNIFIPKAAEFRRSRKEVSNGTTFSSEKNVLYKSRVSFYPFVQLFSLSISFFCPLYFVRTFYL